MKRALILISLLQILSFSQLAGQEKSFNFILVIDGQLWITNTSIAISFPSSNGSDLTQAVATYYPGELVFEQQEYEKIKNSKIDSLTMSFDYYEYQGKKQFLYNFDLPFYASWLDQSYMVMKVYNLEKRKYKGVFKPLDKERNYTFELDYPGGQMLRVRNKVKKKRNK